MNLTQVAVNNNTPPHNAMLLNGNGNYSSDNATLAVTNFNITPGSALPVVGQRYFISGMEGRVIRRFDGTVHSALAAMVMFSNVTLA